MTVAVAVAGEKPCMMRWRRKEEGEEFEYFVVTFGLWNEREGWEIEGVK